MTYEIGCSLEEENLNFFFLFKPHICYIMTTDQMAPKEPQTYQSQVTNMANGGKKRLSKKLLLKHTIFP